MDLDLLETVFEVMRGEDERDHSSLDPEEDDCEVRRIAVLTGDLGLEAPVARAYERAQEVLKDLGFQLVEVVLPELEHAVPAYYTIETAWRGEPGALRGDPTRTRNAGAKNSQEQVHAESLEA